MSCQDADQLPYTRCLHGKRPCHQQDVNRRCIPSVTAAMTDDSKEKIFNSILKPKSTISPSTNGTLHKSSTHTNTSRVRFELPNNETVLPTNTNYSTLNENPRSACTDNIKGKLLLHPHTDLLFIINRVYIINNKPLVRLYYCTRNGVPTTYIIPPLLSFTTTCRLLKLYEEHARFTHKNPVYSPHTSPRQKEYNSSYTVNHHSLNTRLINEYFTGNPAIGYALGMKTDTIHYTPHFHHISYFTSMI